MSKESAMAIVTGGPAPVVPRETIPPATGTEISLPVVAPVPEPSEASRFAQLAKKEARVVALHEEAKAQKAAIEAEKAKLALEKSKIESFESLKKDNPVEALKSLGFTETDIFNFLSASEKKELTPEEQAKKVAEEVLDNYKKEQATAQATAQAERDKQVLGKFRSDISAHVEANKEDYKFCKFKGPEADEIIFNTVIAAMELEPNKPPLTIKEATDVVEQFYRDQDEAMAVLRRPKEGAPTPVVEAPPKAEVSPRPGQRVVNTVPPRATATIASQAPSGKKETQSEKRERLMRKLANGGV